MNKPYPSVSPTSVAILLAAYNAERYLPEQIDSILNQSSKEWTLYIRNDGSKDGTQQVIDSYLVKFPDKIFQIDRGGENLGCNKNFFRLLNSVESSYYMFCDSDDVWMQDRIEIMLREIRAIEVSFKNKPVLVQCDAEIVNEHLQTIAPSLWNFYKVTDSQLTDYNKICVRCTTGGASSIFNHAAKKCLYPIPTNKRLMYDHWLGMNVAKHGCIKPIRIPLKKYRQHSGQVCGLSDGASLFSKVFRFRKALRHWNEDANMLKEIGYGNRVKYFYNRVKIELFH